MKNLETELFSLAHEIVEAFKTSFPFLQEDEVIDCVEDVLKYFIYQREAVNEAADKRCTKASKSKAKCDKVNVSKSSANGKLNVSKSDVKCTCKPSKSEPKGESAKASGKARRLYVTTDELAKILGCSSRNIRYMIKDNIIDANLVKGSYRIPVIEAEICLADKFVDKQFDKLRKQLYSLV